MVVQSNSATHPKTLIKPEVSVKQTRATKFEDADTMFLVQFPPGTTGLLAESSVKVCQKRLKVTSSTSWTWPQVSRTKKPQRSGGLLHAKRRSRPRIWQKGLAKGENCGEPQLSPIIRGIPLKRSTVLGSIGLSGYAAQ